MNENETQDQLINKLEAVEKEMQIHSLSEAESVREVLADALPALISKGWVKPDDWPDAVRSHDQLYNMVPRGGFPSGNSRPNDDWADEGEADKDNDQFGDFNPGEKPPDDKWVE